MRIGIDARMIDSSGIGTYIKNLIYWLPKVSNYEYILFGNEQKLKPYGLQIVQADFPIYGLKEQLFMSRIINNKNIDLMHFTHYTIPIMYSGNMVVNVHDLIHIVYPEYLPSKFALLYAKFMIGSACKKAKRVITISEYTKKDIIKYFQTESKKISITYLAAGDIFKPSSIIAEDMKKKYGKYFLYVGAIRPHKNILFLLESFIKLKKEKNILHKLVLIGKGKIPYINHVRKKISDYSLQNDVLIIEEIKQEELVSFYCGADIFLFPSLYEGFGLPPLEAMSCGCPVISSNTSSLPEVVGDACILVDPNNMKNFTDSIYNVIINENLKKELIKKGFERLKLFSWEKTAKETVNIYKEVLQ